MRLVAPILLHSIIGLKLQCNGHQPCWPRDVRKKANKTGLWSIQQGLQGCRRVKIKAILKQLFNNVSLIITGMDD